MADNVTLTQNQNKAILALLSESTVRDAAKVARLSERTVWRYLAKDAFKAELRSRQDRAISAAVASLSGLAGEAIETLRDVLTNEGASYSVKVRAALGILQERRRIGELEDLAERVSRLEEHLK